MTIENTNNSAWGTPFVAQQVVTAAGTVRSEIGLVILNSAPNLTVRLPEPAIPGKIIEIHNVNVGTVNLTLPTSNTFGEGYTSLPVGQNERLRLYSVGSQQYNVEWLPTWGTIQYTANGSIAAKSGIVTISKATALVGTLMPPNAGTDDGKMLRIVNQGTVAHIITNGGGVQFNGNSGTYTFDVKIGASMVAMAVNGTWHTIPTSNATGTLA